ncbi:MAG: hypothetical protein HY649_12270 [Acidobacteria bacterium]|nr:hypothetical protein [Acidobacteriota bacterium]
MLWLASGERREQARLIVGLMMDQVTECNRMGLPALGISNVATNTVIHGWTLNCIQAVLSMFRSETGEPPYRENESNNDHIQT